MVVHRFEDADSAANMCLDLFKDAGLSLALTGAGVSTDSGVPDFRSKDGLWSKYPSDVMSREFFDANPAKFYKVHQEFLEYLLDARPNSTHQVLAVLEEKKLLRAVMTQNIDGLHEKAGQKKVFNCHGTAYSLTCLDCGREYDIYEFIRHYRKEGHLCAHCGGVVKPDVTLFGEQLPEDFINAARLAEKSDFLLVLGTSLVVYPVAGLVDIVKAGGGNIFVVNRDPVPVEHKVDYVYYGNLKDFSQQLHQLLEKHNG